jgi:hypothetical protein
LGQAGQNLLYLSTELLNPLQRGSLNLHSDRRFDSGQRHVQPVLNGHGPSIA